MVKVFFMAVAMTAVTACNTVDDDRIPSLPVNINLSTQDLWNKYGVAGYGQYRKFILALREPKDFSWVSNTATGYGGVLLISGQNPYNLETEDPLAYDLACPVECKPEIRVEMHYDDMLPVAICPECGSHYDVTELGGSGVKGPAASRRLGLRKYKCLRSEYGGYLIRN